MARRCSETNHPGRRRDTRRRVRHLEPRFSPDSYVVRSRARRVEVAPVTTRNSAHSPRSSTGVEDSVNSTTSSPSRNPAQGEVRTTKAKAICQQLNARVNARPRRRTDFDANGMEAIFVSHRSKASTISSQALLATCQSTRRTASVGRRFPQRPAIQCIRFSVTRTLAQKCHPALDRGWRSRL